MSEADQQISQKPGILGGPPIRPEGPPDWPLRDPEVARVLESVFEDGTWACYHGPHCEVLATALCGFFACEHVFLCSSGTAAIELALRGLNVGHDDEVILAAYDFNGNFHDVLTVGAQPVLVDVAAGNWNLDPANLEATITDATKAVIVSHLHGGIVPMRQLTEIAQAHGIAVIEDACQMPGAIIDGKIAGTWGDVGVLSFGGSKLLSAGRGGAVVTNRSEILQRIRLYTQRGNDAYPLSELQAAVLVPQLEQLERRNQLRTQNAAMLCDQISAAGLLTPFQNARSTNESKPGYYKLGFQYDSDRFGGLSRDLLAQAIRAEGIALDPGFRALHTIHSRRRFRQAGELSNATDADQRVLTLHHPVLLGTASDIEQIPFALEKIRKHATMIRKHFEET